MVRLFVILTGVVLILAGCGTDFLYTDAAPTGDEKPPGPTGLVASDGEHMSLVRLSWEPVSNAVWYNVYRSTDLDGGAFTMIGSNLTVTQFDDTNTVEFFPYYYKVSWFDSFTNESRFSVADAGFSDAWRAPAPAGLTVTAGSNAKSALLAWNDGGNSGAVQYRVYSGRSANGPFIVDTNTTALNTVVTDLPAGTTVYFRVVGLDISDNSSLLSEAVAYAVPPDSGVASPSGLTAGYDLSKDHVALSWSASSDAVSYTVYRAGSQAGAYFPVKSSLAALAWNDTGATPGAEYWYRVTAVNGSGQESLPTDSAKGKRTLPDWNSRTFARAGDGTRVDGVLVSWLPVPGAESYQVHRSDSINGSYSLLQDNVSELQWLDGSAESGLTYWYRIVAVRSNGDSGPQGGADSGFRVYQGGPPMPTGVVGEASGGGLFNPYVRVYWDNMGADRYIVFKSGSYDGPYSEVAVINGTEYKDSGFECGSYYRVACRDSNGRVGPWSAPVEPYAYTTVSGPSGVSASQGTLQQSVQLSWTPGAQTLSTTVKLYRAPTPEGPYTQIGGNLDKDSTGYIDNVPEGVWFYKLQAETSLYTSAFGPVVCGYPAVVPLLPPPASVTAENRDGGNSVALSWDPVSGAEGYIVFRSREENGMYAQISGTVSATGFTNSGCNPDQVYYYKVATVNALSKTGALSLSCNNRSMLPAPEAAMASDGSLINKVTVLWQPVAGAVFYRVFRAQEQDGVYLELGNPVSNDRYYFTDTAPLPGTAYYRVAAFDSAGIPGEFSLPDAGSPKAIPVPDPPASVVASDGTMTNGVTVSWSPVGDAAYYRVARSESINGDYVYVSEAVSNTEWIDSSAGAREYYYKIAAYNSVGLSGKLSGADSGYKSLNELDFFMAVDTTLARSHQKLTLMHKSGTGALGNEFAYGDINGKVFYDAHTSGLGGEVFFDYVGYKDFYLQLDGRIIINANMSENGKMTGQISASSPAYNGTVRFDLVITGGNASGGYWYVSQNGGAETQLAWFPSPSSK